MSMVGRMQGSCPHSSALFLGMYEPRAAGGQAGRQQCTHGPRGSPRLVQAPIDSANKSRTAGVAIWARAYKTGSGDTPLSPETP